MKKINKHISRYLFFTVLMVIIGLIVVQKYNSDKQGKEIGKVMPAQSGVAGLCYHYIREGSLWEKTIEVATNSNELTKYTVYADEFKKQIEILEEEGAYFATLEEIEQFRKIGNYPDKCVWICFDDAEESVYTKVFPYLKEKQIPFTIFVIAGQVGNEDFNNHKLCTWEQLKEMKESNLVSFGSHTYNMHYLEDDQAVFLGKHRYNEFYKDIKKSKEVIEQNLGVEVTSIAYPFGNTNEDIVRYVKKAGFESSFILAPYQINSSNDPYYQNRYLVDRDNFYQIFKEWISN